MVFEEKKITLKDGRSAVLKTPCAEDAEKLLEYIKQSCGETEFLMRYPEEWESMSVENEAKWIEGRRNARNALVITCYVDDIVVGNCEINFRGGIKTSHRAIVAIAIRKEFWNLGIGSAMFCELITAAEANPEIELMELEFLEGNERAKALYEKFGFEIVGERPRACKLKDGRMQTEYLMQREMKK